VREAVALAPDRILLDNMTLETVGQCVAIVRGRVPLEVSGNINLGNVRAYAMTGVTWISVGALTHSARALDLSLQVI
jgi:nicotinate-nucleotide pyrophosphorylase (carboxylating)